MYYIYTVSYDNGRLQLLVLQQCNLISYSLLDQAVDGYRADHTMTTCRQALPLFYYTIITYHIF